MQKFKTFYIHKPEYSEQEWKIYFHYSFDKHTYFRETISLDQNYKIIHNDLEIVSALLSHISIAFGISYYKLFPTNDIIIDFCKIDSFQEQYWKDFYLQGLWEFLYTNNINPNDLCNVSSHWNKCIMKPQFDLSENHLLPIWWWKDSIVSSVLLDEQKTAYTPFIFWKTDAIKNGFLDIKDISALTIKRELDSKLFQMNSQWYYNGHVPITWLISFFMTLVCYMYDYKYIVFSNEKSASEWNTTFHNLNINHQYSKSKDFEDKISSYISTYISTEISYTSLLRDFYEIEIAKIFAEKWKKYFSVFSSCNTNFSIQKKSSLRWCNSCPKCLFVYIILRPFLSSQETIEIFWKELFNDPSLSRLYSELIWKEWIKPFECVWEIEEVQLWSHLCDKIFQDQETALGKIFHEMLFQDDRSEYFKKLHKKYNIDM